MLEGQIASELELLAVSSGNSLQTPFKRGKEERYNVCIVSKHSFSFTKASGYAEIALK